jgi:hypothetical protein
MALTLSQLIKERKNDVPALLADISLLITKTFSVSTPLDVTLSKFLENKTLPQCVARTVTLPLEIELTGTVRNLSDQNINLYTFVPDTVIPLDNGDSFKLSEGVPLELNIVSIHNRFPVRTGLKTSLTPKDQHQNLYTDIIPPYIHKDYQAEPKRLIPLKVSQTRLQNLLRFGASFTKENLTNGCLLVTNNQLKTCQQRNIVLEDLVLVPSCSRLLTYLEEMMTNDDPIIELDTSENENGKEGARCPFVLLSADFCRRTLDESPHLASDIQFVSNLGRAGAITFHINPVDFENPTKEISFLEATTKVYNATAMSESPEKHSANLAQLEQQEFKLDMTLELVVFLQDPQTYSSSFILDDRLKLLEDPITGSYHVHDPESNITIPIQPFSSRPLPTLSSPVEVPETVPDAMDIS